MRILLNQLLGLPPDPWGTILVIGARPEGSLDVLRSLRSERLLLVQAQPEQARMLDRFIDPARGEEVLAVAVTASGDGQPVKLRVCNIPRFNCLAVPTGLKDLLPNVSIVDEIDVPARSLQSIAQKAGMDASKRNLLIVDAPGQWCGLIEEPAALALFSSIIAVVGEEPLYSKGGSLADVLAHLHGVGFDDIASDPEAIYPLAVRALRRNDASIELGKLKQQLDCLVRERDGQAARVDELEVKLAQQLEKEQDDASKLADLRARVKAAAIENADLVERKAELEKAQVQASGEQAKRVDELERELGALIAERDREAGVAAERTMRVGELEKELTALTAERNREAGSAGERLKQIDGLKQRLGKLESDLAASSDSLSLAVRLQTLRENDLEDLRKRYATLHDAHQAQRILLGKLSERLVIANRYFQQLAASDALEVREMAEVDAPRAAPLIGTDGATGRSRSVKDPAKGTKRSSTRRSNARNSESGKQ